MVKRVAYINKITREVSPTLEQWMENLADPADKENALRIYTTEVQRSETKSSGIPDQEYITMFERYFNESNIEIIVTEV